MTHEPTATAKQNLIRIDEVKARTGLSRSSIYAFMNKGHFPKSVHITGISVAWVEHEVDEWIAVRISQSRM